MKLSGGILFFVLLSVFAWAGSTPSPLPYYGKEFYDGLSQGRANQELINELRQILHGAHRPIPGAFDEILTDCQNKECYRHITLGYDRARTFMMGEYYLVEDGSSYALPDVYCDQLKTAKDFPKDPPGPNKIPLGTVLNTEHTWPQSKFTTQYDREQQKSDIHHLYPTDSQLNAIRGNNEFGEVVKETKPLKCASSHFGKPASGNNDVFEPPQRHKGNVARALFYFSVNYELPISPQQEATLRQWHHEDPVDAAELDRNEKIFQVQRNRNPFVDHPELVERINNF